MRMDQLLKRIQVSTHAPTRGATVNSVRKLNIPPHCIHFKWAAAEKSTDSDQYTPGKLKTPARTSPLHATA